MKKKTILKVALMSLMLAAVLGACRKDREELKMDDQLFVTQASSSNNFEVQAGALAMTKGQNAAVKTYGEHMVNDHTAVGQQMKALADRKGWSIPVGLQTKEQDKLNLLASTSTTDFDREFARLMVQSHQEAIDLFSTASSTHGVGDGELRSFAESKLPALRAHLQEAQQLQTQVGP